MDVFERSLDRGERGCLAYRLEADLVHTSLETVSHQGELVLLARVAYGRAEQEPV